MAAFALCDAARMEREARSAQSANDRESSDQDNTKFNLHFDLSNNLFNFFFR
jgi:hypothetical protein